MYHEKTGGIETIADTKDLETLNQISDVTLDEAAMADATYIFNSGAATALVVKVLNTNVLAAGEEVKLEMFRKEQLLL